MSAKATPKKAKALTAAFSAFIKPPIAEFTHSRTISYEVREVTVYEVTRRSNFSHPYMTGFGGGFAETVTFKSKSEAERYAKLMAGSGE